MDYRIRAADLDDLDALVEGNLGIATETEDLELDAERLRRGVRRALEGRGRYFVAEHEGRVVGQLMVCTEWSDWRDGEFWWIESVYVASDHRRRGVYRQLFEHVQARARASDDVCGIRLYVERDNVVSEAAHLALGMRRSDYRLFELDFVVERGGYANDC